MLSYSASVYACRPTPASMVSATAASTYKKHMMAWLKNKDSSVQFWLPRQLLRGAQMLNEAQQHIRTAAGSEEGLVAGRHARRAGRTAGKLASALAPPARGCAAFCSASARATSETNPRGLNPKAGALRGSWRRRWRRPRAGAPPSARPARARPAARPAPRGPPALNPISLWCTVDSNSKLPVVACAGYSVLGWPPARPLCFRNHLHQLRALQDPHAATPHTQSNSIRHSPARLPRARHVADGWRCSVSPKSCTVGSHICSSNDSAARLLRARCFADARRTPAGRAQKPYTINPNIHSQACLLRARRIADGGVRLQAELPRGGVAAAQRGRQARAQQRRQPLRRSPPAALQRLYERQALRVTRDLY